MNSNQTLYEQVMTDLRSKRIPQRQIALGSGVPFSTVCKIAQGSVKDPGVHTIQRLADFFSRHPAEKNSQACVCAASRNASEILQGEFQ
jgi:transcriptional regulator with XRE-family HTH domain